jgi:hypothetical protein
MYEWNASAGTDGDWVAVMDGSDPVLNETGAIITLWPPNIDVPYNAADWATWNAALANDNPALYPHSTFGAEGAHIASARGANLYSEWIIVPGHGRFLTFTLQNLSEVPVEVDLFADDEESVVTADLPVQFAIAEIVGAAPTAADIDALDFAPLTADLEFEGSVILPAVMTAPRTFVLAWVWLLEDDDGETGDAAADAIEANDEIDTAFGVDAANWLWRDTSTGDNPAVWVANNAAFPGDPAIISEDLDDDWEDVVARAARGAYAASTPGFFFDAIGIRVTQIDA